MSVLCFTWRKISWSCFSVVQTFLLFLSFAFTGGKESCCSVGDSGLIPRSRRSPGEGNGNPLQFLAWKKTHGQRSLACYSPWDCRVRRGWATSLYTLKLTSLKPLSPDWLVWMDEPFVFTVLYVTHSWTNENIPFLSCHKNINN